LQVQKIIHIPISAQVKADGRNVEKEWIRLIDYVRERPYCRIEIEFAGGVPRLILRVLETIKL